MSFTEGEDVGSLVVKLSLETFGRHPVGRSDLKNDKKFNIECSRISMVMVNEGSGCG